MNMQIDYAKLNKFSIHVFPQLTCPEDVINMECGQTRGLKVRGEDEGFILVEKYEGTALKNAIHTGSLHKPPFDFKVMIINEQRHPMFIDKKKQIYFCDNIDAMNKAGRVEDPIWVSGPYEYAINNTVMEFSDGSNKRSEYYVIVYTKGNLYDGTRHFIRTSKLEDYQQIGIRRAQKRMISAIMRMYVDRQHEEKMREKRMREEELEKNRAIIQEEFMKSFEFFPAYVMVAIISFIIYMLYEIYVLN